jgi:hypothetical protein
MGRAEVSDIIARAIEQGVVREQTDRERAIMKALDRRQAIFEEIRKPTDLLWQDCDDYIIPRREQSKINKGNSRDRPRPGSKIYDNIAGSSAQDLADGMQGHTASPLLIWHLAQFRSEKAKRDQRGRVWMDEVMEAGRAEIAASNFYEQLNECYTDDVLYGVSHMVKPVWDTQRKVLCYVTLNPRDIWFGVNHYGMVDIRNRQFPIQGRQILQQFPDAPLTKQLLKKIIENPQQEFMCIHATFPREERDTSSLDILNKPIASFYYLVKEKILLSESGMDEDEIATWLWRTMSGETYPRSPAIDAIWDTLTVNAMAKSLLNAAQLAVDPAVIASESMKGRLNIRKPGSATFKETANDTVEAFQYPEHFRVGVEEINKLKSELRNRFAANTFDLLAALDKVFTATQTTEIVGEKTAKLGPLVTRNQNQLLIPMLNATYKVLAQNGRLPEPPTSVREYMSSPLDYTFMGPVAVAARRYLQMLGINAALPSIGMVAEMFPNANQEIADEFELGEIARHIYEISGSPQIGLRDPRKRDEIKANRAKLNQQMMQLQVAQQAAESYPKTTKAPEKGSPAEGAMAGAKK